MACKYGSTVLRNIRKNGLSCLRKLSTPAPNVSSSTEYDSKLCFLEPESAAPIPTYRVLSQSGHFIDPTDHPHIEESIVLKMYTDMTRLNFMEKRLYDCHKQGRITFYLTSFGEEATQIGSAAALNSKDLIFGQYRESGVLMWRDFPMSQFFHQCYSNTHDWNKGRQIPVHYGSKEHGFVTISSTTATQIPQAAGAAYAFKRQKNGQCVMCYFGDGATSEGDAHAGFNFAAVLNCPVIFLCRNNGYAISTPTTEQYRGDGIASRGVGYGMTTIRVDGNDTFAMYNATREAKQICVTKNRPVLIEAMTYRLGNHSTSEDSSIYRPEQEVETWDKHHHPITRLRNYLVNQGLWDEEKEEELLTATKQEVMNAMVVADSAKKGNPIVLFDDVYDKMPVYLEHQRDEFKRHLNMHKEHYQMEHYEQDTISP